MADENTNDINSKKKVTLKLGTADDVGSSEVVVYLENLDAIEYGIKHEVSTSDDILSGNGAIGKITDTIKKIQDVGYTAVALSAAASKSESGINILNEMNDVPQKYMSKYQNAPVYKKTVANSYEFKCILKWGMLGSYSGWSEVVNPILTVVKHFSVYPISESATNSFRGPAPTQNEINAALFSSLLEGDTNRGKISDMFEANLGKNDTLLNGIQSTAQTIVKEVYNAYDKAIEDSLQYAKALYVNVGDKNLGPFSVGKISYSFDFSNIDNDNYPCLGELTLGDVKSIKMPTDSYWPQFS